MALRHPRQVALPLRVAAEQGNRAAAEPLHREGEIGEPGVIGECLAADGQAAHVQLVGKPSPCGGNAVTQESGAAQRRDQLAADLVDVGIVQKIMPGAPGIE